MFQSTHPRGVRPSGARLAPSWRRGFNPRTRVGCDKLTNDQVAQFRRVSIHAPAWGATHCLHCFVIAVKFQSTHPRGVRRGGFQHEPALSPVSIHAPAWGATQPVRQPLHPIRVSIHAPAWGATSTASRCSSSTPGFNPRTRVGCDSLTARKSCATCAFQSTHPRGVRPTCTQRGLHGPRCFNPRTRVGCDTVILTTVPSAVVFQSTHPRGVRPDVFHIRCAQCRVSIHAPAWGATAARRAFFLGDGVSIHAPAWGATLCRKRAPGC